MKKNQKGFTLVEGLLVVIVIAVVAGVGFYVYSANKNNNKKDDTAVVGSKENNTDDNEKKQPGKPVEITALGVKINDPEGRGLDLKIVNTTNAVDGGPWTRYLIKDSNEDYHTRCGYPASVSEDEDANAGSLKVGSRRYWVGHGTNFQAQCDSQTEADTKYEDNLIEYIKANLAEL